MKYNYILPDEKGKREEHSTNNNSLIIIGANGSGKSKLGAWMEKNNLEDIHRVGAQRSLNFKEFISLKSYEQASNLLLYGRDKKEVNKGARWHYGEQYTTKLLDDYEYALSSIIALKNNQIEKYLKECKEKDTQGIAHDRVPENVIDVLKRIWKNVFPQREIDFSDSKVTAVYNENKTHQISYKGNEMSDGVKGWAIFNRTVLKCSTK